MRYVRMWQLTVVSICLQMILCHYRFAKGKITLAEWFTHMDYFGETHLGRLHFAKT